MFQQGIILMDGIESLVSLISMLLNVLLELQNPQDSEGRREEKTKNEEEEKGKMK